MERIFFRDKFYPDHFLSDNYFNSDTWIGKSEEEKKKKKKGEKRNRPSKEKF